MSKKDFLEEKYCEINKLKSLLQVYPKEYCNTIIKVMDNVFDEISDYLKEKQKEYKNSETINSIKDKFKKEDNKYIYEKTESIKITTENKSKESKHDKHKSKKSRESQKTFTLEELSKYNGKNGNPSYVAVNGIVYDVSKIRQWQGGAHYGLMAGQDLSSYFKACHADNLNIIDNAIVVGSLIEDNKRYDEDNTFTLEELSMYNGMNNNQAYVAVNGIVYDVTEVMVWNTGRHYGLYAGRDLTQYFNNCHKSELDKLDRLKVVGKLVK